MVLLVVEERISRSDSGDKTLVIYHSSIAFCARNTFE